MNNSEIIGAKQTSQPFHKGEKEREKMEVEMGVGEKEGAAVWTQYGKETTEAVRRGAMEERQRTKRQKTNKISSEVKL